MIPAPLFAVIPFVGEQKESITGRPFEDHWMPDALFAFASCATKITSIALADILGERP